MVAFGEQESRQSDRRRPSLGPFCEALDLRVSQLAQPHTPEECRDLLDSETQVVRPNLHQLVRCSQRGHSDRGIGTRGDDDLQPGGSVSQERGYLLVDGRALCQVEVVEDEGHRALGGVELFEQHRENGCVDLIGVGAQRCDRSLADAGRGAGEGGDDVAPQANRLCVPSIECHPREGLC
ncbi:hypothetical protein [Nocardioides endophyticus]|uniref:hypothetical protein n=1 Tax=Nocardioides endophyticus TaxID=1353775 RepID=UPI0031EF881E